MVLLDAFKLIISTSSYVSRSLLSLVLFSESFLTGALHSHYLPESLPLLLPTIFTTFDTRPQISKLFGENNHQVDPNFQIMLLQKVVRSSGALLVKFSSDLHTMLSILEQLAMASLYFLIGKARPRNIADFTAKLH